MNIDAIGPAMNNIEWHLQWAITPHPESKSDRELHTAFARHPATRITPKTHDRMGDMTRIVQVELMYIYIASSTLKTKPAVLRFVNEMCR